MNQLKHLSKKYFATAPRTKNADVLVIGGGSGGLGFARKAASLG